MSTPHYWRSRAEKVRTIAESMVRPETMMIMLHVADSYDRLAERAERLEQMDRQGRAGE